VIIKRCAIYTRKSSSEGLDRGFNSLDAQRQFCESYIASQAGEGWTALDTRYDDGGFSGGSLDRPAVRRLMADVAAGTVDTVVVYKIDRLSRSLIDFSSLIGRFEAHGVSFVAVTQAFNTTSSMGRLTLNVLLSFAQFERELASERLRDKAAASRARGLWQAGPRPFGYQVERGRLILDEGEAEAIRYAYRRYPKVGAARLLAQELTAKGILNKTGMPFTKKSVTDLLKNRLYRGDLVHRGKSVPGVHMPIVTRKAGLGCKRLSKMSTGSTDHSPGPPFPTPSGAACSDRRASLSATPFATTETGFTALYPVRHPSPRQRRQLPSRRPRRCCAGGDRRLHPDRGPSWAGNERP